MRKIEQIPVDDFEISSFKFVVNYTAKAEGTEWITFCYLILTCQDRSTYLFLNKDIIS